MVEGMGELKPARVNPDQQNPEVSFPTAVQ